MSSNQSKEGQRFLTIIIVAAVGLFFGIGPFSHCKRHSSPTTYTAPSYNHSSGSYRSSQPSFTGSSKYDDDDYNRKQMNYWLDQEAYYRAKGDYRKADACHSTAMDHKRRIGK